MKALSDLAERMVASLTSPPPHVVGISGAVAVGKSTIAAELSRILSDRRNVSVVATDAFLYPNSVLDERGLTLRKGFPESFDIDRLLSFVNEVRAGTERVELPLYSHVTYDIVEDDLVVIEQPDLVLLEGVIALHESVAAPLDLTVYVHGDESDVREWFVRRFLALTEEAADNPRSFYRVFAQMPVEEIRRIAEATWDGINGPNLREHIMPAKDRATFVVTKGSDHSITSVTGPVRQKR